MEDGIVVYITSGISDILGFPQDMLLGRNFIDFVHPKDRMPFASHITSGTHYPGMEPHQQSQLSTGKCIIFKIKLNLHLLALPTLAAFITQKSTNLKKSKNS